MRDAERMDIHEALDEVRVQKERLEEELHTKTDLCNNLKKAQNELVIKFQEVKLQSEKQTEELGAKTEELCKLSQLHEELKSSFQEKESALRHVNLAIEKLRFEYGEKIQKLVGENKELVLALDEATTISESLKLKVNTGNMEIEDLKRVLSLKDKKLLETTEKAQTNKDLNQRDEVICKLEEANRKFQDQLKWKNEQFEHLEEAHGRLQDNFRSSKAEWESEKSLMMGEICSLQTRLDSQTRISENLQTQLRICNQALAHEESTRKLLEIEVSEYKSRFDNIFSECHEAKMKIEKLSRKRDEEVAKLREDLATKDCVSKEMGYKLTHLEHENQDLTASLKEFRESQIVSCGTTGSLKKLQKKYQNLEQLHKKCTENVKEKEIEWKSQTEKVKKEMGVYLSKLKVQTEQVKQLQEELESCYFSLEVQNEETFSVYLVLKSEFSVAYSNLFTEVSKLEWRNKESEETIVHLKRELEIKNNDLREVTANLDKKCEETASLMKRVDWFDNMKRSQLFMEEELQRHKEMLAESSKNKILLEEQVRLLENPQKLDDEENQSLTCKTKEQNEKIIDLQQKVVVLETLVTERTEAIEEQKQEKEKYFKIIEDKETNIENLLIVSEQEKKSLLRVIEELEKEMTDSAKISEEKQIEIDVIRQSLNKLETKVLDLSEKVKIKDESLSQSYQRVEELEVLMGIKKLEIEKSRGQFEDEKRRLEVQNKALVEDIKKLSLDKEDLLNQMELASKHAEELEVLLGIKKLEIEKLRGQFEDLKRRLEVQNEGLLKDVKKLSLDKEDSLILMEITSKHAEELEVLLGIKKLEMEKFEDEKRRLESIAKNLEVQNEALLEDIKKLSLEREDLLIQMEIASKKMDEFSWYAVELMEMLENTLQKSGIEAGVVKLPFSPLQKGKNEMGDARLPLVGLNK